LHRGFWKAAEKGHVESQRAIDFFKTNNILGKQMEGDKPN
tara:strand:+ start:129 stop:248 length:120 start_codon:yes stop_codon:yes gene_type:complete